MAVPAGHVRPPRRKPSSATRTFRPAAQGLGDGRRRARAPGQEPRHARRGQRRRRGGRPGRERARVAGGDRGHAVARDVEQQGQAPRGHVVDLVRQPLPPPAILLLHERLVHRDARVEQVADEAAGRLRERHDVGPGRERSRRPRAARPRRRAPRHPGRPAARRAAASARGRRRAAARTRAPVPPLPRARPRAGTRRSRGGASPGPAPPPPPSRGRLGSGFARRRGT